MGDSKSARGVAEDADASLGHGVFGLGTWVDSSHRVQVDALAGPDDDAPGGGGVADRGRTPDAGSVSTRVSRSSAGSSSGSSSDGSRSISRSRSQGRRQGSGTSQSRSRSRSRGDSSSDSDADAATPATRTHARVTGVRSRPGGDDTDDGSEAAVPRIPVVPPADDSDAKSSPVQRPMNRPQQRAPVHKALTRLQRERSNASESSVASGTSNASSGSASGSPKPPVTRRPRPRRRKSIKEEATVEVNFLDDVPVAARDTYYVMFVSIDRDKGGTVSVQEMEHAFKTMNIDIDSTQLHEMMHEIDEDGNGEVDFSEFAVMMHRLLSSKAQVGDDDDGDFLTGFVYSNRSLAERIRARVWTFMEEPSSGPLAKATSMSIMLLITLSCSIFIVETLPQYHHVPEHVANFEAIDLVCVMAFTMEYVTRFIVSPDKSVFMRTPLNNVDLVAILPFYVELAAGDEAASSSAVLRAMRLIRVFRVAKLGRYLGWMSVFTNTILQSLKPLAMVAFVISICLVFLASAEYFAERGVWHDEVGYVADGVVSPFSSIPGAFYWCILTLTTVGYGDVVPTTWIGQIVASITGIAGVMILAIPISVMSTSFHQQYNTMMRNTWIRETQADKVKRAVQELRHMQAMELEPHAHNSSQGSLTRPVAETDFVADGWQKALSFIDEETDDGQHMSRSSASRSRGRGGSSSPTTSLDGRAVTTDSLSPSHGVSQSEYAAAPEARPHAIPEFETVDSSEADSPTARRVIGDVSAPIPPPTTSGAADHESGGMIGILRRWNRSHFDEIAPDTPLETMAAVHNQVFLEMATDLTLENSYDSHRKWQKVERDSRAVLDREITLIEGMFAVQCIAEAKRTEALVREIATKWRMKRSATDGTPASETTEAHISAALLKSPLRNVHVNSSPTRVVTAGQPGPLLGPAARVRDAHMNPVARSPMGKLAALTHNMPSD